MFTNDGVMYYDPGDMVVLVEDHPDGNKELLKGDFGVVLYDLGIDTGMKYAVNVCVEWEKSTPSGYKCYDGCREGHGWKVARGDIELVPPPKEADIKDAASMNDIMSFFGIQPR